MIKKVFFVCCFIFLAECSFSQRALTDEQMKRYLPKKEVKFHLSETPVELIDTSILTLKGIYLQSEYLCAEKCDTLFTYMRFFSDGKVYVSFAYLSYPTKKEFYDLSYGKFGRFIIEDSNKIKIELFMNREHGIMYMWARPTENGIQFYKTSGRGLGQILKVSRERDGGYYQKVYNN